jgi:hypothetical protein
MFTRRQRWWGLGTALVLLVVAAVPWLALPRDFTEEQMDGIQTGMTADQVAAIMGRAGQEHPNLSDSLVQERVLLWAGHSFDPYVSFDVTAGTVKNHWLAGGPGLLDRLRWWLGR